jgi:hypothetical protein
MSIIAGNSNIMRHILNGTGRAELLIRLRSPLMPLRLLFIVALCVGLTPITGARYSILQIGGKIPGLSIDTAPIAAGVALNFIAFAFLCLTLDIGSARDYRLRINEMMKNQPASVGSIVLGRYLANVVYGAVFITLVDIVLLVTLSFKYGQLPSLLSITALLSLSLPMITTAALLGMVLELLFRNGPVKRALATIVVWTSLAIAAILGGRYDIFGTRVLQSGISGDERPFAIGFLPVEGKSFFSWVILDDRIAGATAGHLLFACVCLAIGAITAQFLSPSIYKDEKSHVYRGLIDGAVNYSQRRDQSLAFAPPVIAHDAAPGPAIFAVTEHLLRRAPLILFVVLATLCIGIFRWLPPGNAIALLLMIPFLALVRTTSPDIKIGNTIEMIEPSLLFPTYNFFILYVIIALAIVSAVPVFINMPIVQILTAISGLVFLSSWLIWAYRIINSPVFGGSLAVFLIYLIVFNDVPPSIDIFGINHSSPVALVSSLMMAIGALSLMGWKGR